MKSVVPSLSVLKWINGVVGKNKIWVFYLTLIQICQGVAGVVFALSLRNVIDCAVEKNKKELTVQLLILCFLALLSIALQTLNKYIDEKARARLDKVFRCKSFSDLLSSSYADVTEIHSGEWMNRIVSDTNVVISAVVQIIPGITGTAVRLVGAGVMIAVLLPKFVAVLLPAGIVIAAFSLLFRNKLKSYHKAIQNSDGKVRSFMQERLLSLIVIKSFIQEKRTEEIAKEYMDEFGKIRVQRIHFVNLCTTALHLAMRGAYVLGVCVCSVNIANGLMSYGTMMAILQLVTQIETPFAQISSFLPQYYSMIASAERLIEIEKLPADCDEEMLSQSEIQKFYENDFDSVGLSEAYFSYKDSGDGKTHVLNRKSISVNKGEYVAFMGESGCGKSTAMKLMMCLYPLDSGERYLKTEDGSKINLSPKWRGLFAYVPQGNCLVSGTVRDVLAFGNPDASKNDAEIYKALKIACADTFVDELPDGIDSRLGEQGTGISEGQMQRLAIARAVMSGRPILLFDEATSSLDSVTEEKVLQNLRTMTDRTVILITHRTATLDICDKIIQF